MISVRLVTVILLNSWLVFGCNRYTDLPGDIKHVPYTEHAARITDQPKEDMTHVDEDEGEDEDIHLEDYLSCDKPLFLTPLIEEGRIRKARKLAKVRLLESAGKIKSYSGYLTVNKNCNSNLFFWFFPSLNKDKNAPVTLWLPSVLGTSSMTGLFQEIGPFYVECSTENLVERNYSWNAFSSLLFIDSPVGSGFSFTDNDECLAKNEDDVRNDLYSALIQFFKLFPKLQNNDFYIFGESYSGKIIPAIAYSIHENNPRAELKINLKGLGIGNGLSDPQNMLLFSDYVYQLGLIDHMGKIKVHEIEKKCHNSIENHEWKTASHKFYQIYDEIQKLVGKDINLDNYAETMKDRPNFCFYYKLLENSTRCEIHTGDMCFGCQFYKMRHALQSDVTKSVKPWIEELIEFYPILFYNGQFDITIPFPATRNFLNKMTWSGADEFKKTEQKSFYDSLQENTCGYIQSYKNLNLAMVRNAGLMVPFHQPECASELYKRFLFDRENMAR